MADKRNSDNSKIEELYKWIAYDLQALRGELIDELKLSSAQVKALYQGVSDDKDASASAIAQEIRYGYKQNQSIYDGLSEAVKAVDDKLAALNQLLSEVGELKYSYQQLQNVYETLSSEVAPKVAELADKEETKAIVEDSVSVHSQQILDAIGEGQSVDYARITNEVGDKLLEILEDLKENDEQLSVDYEKIAGDTAEKVVESLPYPEPIDYSRIEESIANAVAEAINVDAIADLVVEKLATKGISADVILDDEGIDKVAQAVADKIDTAEAIDYDKVCIAAQAAQILPDPVDYDRIAEIVDDKLATGIEKVVTLDDEGIDKIVDGVAEELRNMTLVCEYEDVEEEAPVEEVAEIAEEVPVEEVEEVVVEEPVALPLAMPAEAPVEEVVEEPIVEELAIAAEPVYEEDINGQLIDAETGLVIRLKRSFTAKMKQSDEKIKAYYSDIKNALTGYKRINSNVSWHGDRFNFGRDTIAKMGINGKTLCFYLALDPNDEELKQTVYHQKNVGDQKAYESTPFMIKVKSDAGAKKALRLVAILTEKLGAEAKANFEAVDYVAEFAYASTKRLFEEGYIKATKEKKVDFNF